MMEVAAMGSLLHRSANMETEPVSFPQIVVRRRGAEDITQLAEILAAQQRFSRYPFRWPLPFPVEQFIVRESEEAAWVAERDGRLVGHVSVGRPRADLAAAFAAVTGAADVATVSVLFVDRSAQGSGVGGRLLDTAVGWAREHRRLPVLDVFPSHGAALAVYRHRGWHEVGQHHPAWLPEGEEPLILMTLPG